MFDENVKTIYRNITPPAGMKQRVMASCRTAKQKRTRRQKQMVSFAACLMIVVGVSVYGFFPKPVIYSGEQTLENGVLPVAYESIDVDPAIGVIRGRKMLATHASEIRVVKEENCIPFQVDRTATVTVSKGKLYRLDPTTEIAQVMGTSCKVEPGMQMYWQCAAEEPVASIQLYSADDAADDPQTDAELEVHTDMRTVKLHLVQDNNQWFLKQ